MKAFSIQHVAFCNIFSHCEILFRYCNFFFATAIFFVATATFFIAAKIFFFKEVEKTVGKKNLRCENFFRYKFLFQTEAIFVIIDLNKIKLVTYQTCRLTPEWFVTKFTFIVEQLLLFFSANLQEKQDWKFEFITSRLNIAVKHCVLKVDFVSKNTIFE